MSGGLPAAVPKSGQLPRLGACLLSASGADRRLHVLFFLRRREDRFHAERFNPQLAAPALAVIEVLVFLVLDFLVRLPDRLAPAGL